MSKIGEKEIILPSGINITKYRDKTFVLSGPHGSLSIKLSENASIKVKKSKIIIAFINSKNFNLQGLTKSLVNNIVDGIKNKFSRNLIIQGIGYAFLIKDNLLLLTLGYSHDIIYHIPLTIKIKCVRDYIICVQGCDKSIVGRVSSDIRTLKRFNSYKSKGIKYIGELVLRKDVKKK